MVRTRRPDLDHEVALARDVERPADELLVGECDLDHLAHGGRLAARTSSA